MNKQKYRLMAALASVVCASALANADGADAYVHRWECSRGEGNHCTDNSGQAFNPWAHIEAESWGFYPTAPERGLLRIIVGTICVGARTQHGNERSFYGPACKHNRSDWHGDLAPDPHSQAYVYWADGDGILGPAKLLMRGYANT